MAYEPLPALPESHGQLNFPCDHSSPLPYRTGDPGVLGALLEVPGGECLVLLTMRELGRVTFPAQFTTRRRGSRPGEVPGVLLCSWGEAVWDVESGAKGSADRCCIPEMWGPLMTWVVSSSSDSVSRSGTCQGDGGLPDLLDSV